MPPCRRPPRHRLGVHPDLKDVPRVRALIDAVVAAFEAERERLPSRKAVAMPERLREALQRLTPS